MPIILFVLILPSQLDYKILKERDHVYHLLVSTMLWAYDDDDDS